MSLIHISKPSISKIPTIKTPTPKHPFDGSRGSVQSFCHSVPSFRHSLTSPLFTFRQSKNCLHSNNDPFQGMTAPTNSISTVGNPSKSAIHQKTNIPPFHHSIISENVLEVRHYVRIQRHRVIQYVTVTNHPCNGY